MRNSNCLQGLACPKCGNHERLVIEVASLASVTDEGTDIFGDVQWHSTSYCECPGCWHRGTVADFHSNGQDESSTNHSKGDDL